MEPEIEPVEIRRRPQHWSEIEISVPGLLAALAVAFVGGVWLAIVMN
jgi:hypothetical protein